MHAHELRPVQSMAASLFFRKRRLLLMLPRQEGKTELGIRLQHDLTLRGEPSTCMFVAKNTLARKKASREKFLRIFDRDQFAVNTELVYLKRHPTSQIFMGSIDKDPGSQRGGTVKILHMSEMAHWTLDHGMSIIQCWQTVLRPLLKEFDGYALGETTPQGHNGFKDMWDNAAEFGFSTLRVSYSQMCEMGLVSREDYDREKREVHPLAFAQELDCEWVTFVGRAYDEFDEQDPAIVSDWNGPSEWQKVCSAIDFGFSPSATCALFGYRQGENFYVYDEIYAMRQRLEDLAESIDAHTAHYNILPQNHVAVGDHEEDRIEELNLRGINCGKANKVNVLGARIQIKELLWKKRLKIHPRCKHLIKELNQATWNPKKDGDLNYAECTDGHFDSEAALRYLIRELSGVEAEEPEVNPHVGVDQSSATEWELRRNFRAT